MRVCLKKGNKVDFQPSRLFIYYYARICENTPVTEDNGITLRSGLKSIQKYGVCDEECWEYDTSKFSQEPTQECILKAKKHIIYKYEKLSQDLEDIKHAVYLKYPVLFGIQVYETFEENKNGLIPIPDTLSETHYGAHCVSIIGYDDINKEFVLANSWGSNWGYNGYFSVSYDYILNPDLASNFWIIVSFS